MTGSAPASPSPTPPDPHEHLLVARGNLCWWCQSRVANTREHKYKRSDLKRIKGPGSLTWVGEHRSQQINETQRDRYGLLKFEKSLCGYCNNTYSQPFDYAYEKFSKYLGEYAVHAVGAVSFEDVYGETWEQDVLNLARYYAKHFGCRLVSRRYPVPDSLRAFMNGATILPDANMSLVTTDSVRRVAKDGLTLGGDYAEADEDRTHFTTYVMASYVGSVGVRFQWWAPDAPTARQLPQFFDGPTAAVTRFADHSSVIRGIPRRPGFLTRLLRWLA